MYSILYVDDEEINLRGFQMLFEEQYKIYTATSGKKGLEILKATPEIKLIITDQRMPEMTGVEFLTQAQAVTPESMRVILTGYSDINVIIEAVNECNIYRYLSKPWKENEMSEAIKSAIELYQLREDNRNLCVQLKKINESLEETVKDRTAHLVELNDEKNRLINVVSHDLRTPLNQILGLTDIVSMKEFALTEEAGKIVSKIADSAKRLSLMIKRILDVGSIESGKMNIQVERVNLTEVVEMVSENFLITSKEKRIRIVNDFSTDPVFVQVDKNYFVEVLENLLSNAIKFSDYDKSVYVQIKKNHQSIQTVIKDEGPGIPLQEQPKLFQNFQTLSTRPTAGEPSTGLGLAICKKYTEAMNGTIVCDSMPGRGTAFIIEFPASS